MTPMGKSVVLAGGGTAGHIEPMLAVADALRSAHPTIGLTCLGTARGLEVGIVPARGYELRLIPPVPLPRKVTPELLRVPWRLLGSVRAAGRVLRGTRADVLVGFGGYVALPAYLAARRARIPIVVHEQNALPGLANRIAARFADVVAVTSPGTPLRGAEVVGMPLRSQVAHLDRAALRPRALHHFGLEAGVPTLLVFGGSQGARSLNSALAGAVEQLRGLGVQILHAVGPNNLAGQRSEPPAQPAGGKPPTGGSAPRVPPDSNQDSSGSAVPYVVLPYLERMDLAYAAADLALCRAGAVTCAELSAVGLPAVFVPLPIGNGEQRRNAEPIVEAGGALLVEDRALTRDYLLETVASLLLQPDRLAAMAEATAAFGRRDAAQRMAELIMTVAGQGMTACPDTGGAR